MFFHFFLNWSIVDLQCLNFCCTAKWFSYTYVYIRSFSCSFPYALSRDTEHSFLHCTAEPCCLSILCIIVCICWPQTPVCFLPRPSPPGQPQVCSLGLWVCFCFIERFICVRFSIPHISNIIWLSFFFWLSMITSASSTFLQMALFHSFLCVLSYSTVYIYHIFIHSSVDGHLVCFHMS